jgi:hypothetical protein
VDHVIKLIFTVSIIIISIIILVSIMSELFHIMDKQRDIALTYTVSMDASRSHWFVLV